MTAKALPIAKFRLGKIVSTPNALDRLTQDDILRAIDRLWSNEVGKYPAGKDRQKGRGAVAL